MITWDQIETETGDFRAGFVEIFQKYEGQETDEKDEQNRTVKVTMSSFARHAGIAESTFREWARAAAAAVQPRQRDRTREAIGRMSADEKAALARDLPPAAIAAAAAEPGNARAIARNDAAREAVEDQAIEHRARVANPERDRRLAEAPERVRQSMGRALGAETDLATDYLNGAANDLAHATLAKEEWGIKFPDAEGEAIAKIERALAIYRANSPVTEDDRGWLDTIGVDL